MAGKVRIGTGSGSQSDPVGPALEIAESGSVDFLVYDSQSERTYIDQARRANQNEPGYDDQLRRKLAPVLAPSIAKGIRIISNGGGADLDGALRDVARVCQMADIDATVATIGPSSILDVIRRLDPIVSETGVPVSTFGNKLIAAQAYQGARPIVEALHRGADIILSSRAGDAAQYLAPLVHVFGWSWDDWDTLAGGLCIGHLLECGGQVTGGFFADPGLKDIENLPFIGFPIAEVYEDGSALITKVPGSGGEVSIRTCKEQLVYELGDPQNYIHNDGIANLTGVEFKQADVDAVFVSGAQGKPRPSHIKVALGVTEGYMAVGRIAYGGRGCVARARLAGETIRKRLEQILDVDEKDLRINILGVDGLFAWEELKEEQLREVVLRVAGRFSTLDEAKELIWGIDQLTCNGPAAGGIGLGVDYSGIAEIIGYYTTFIPRDQVPLEINVESVGGAR